MRLIRQFFMIVQLYLIVYTRVTVDMFFFRIRRNDIIESKRSYNLIDINTSSDKRSTNMSLKIATALFQRRRRVIIKW